ncbi:MAG TPA: bacteriocin [Kofleriaceae bacterium]|nr:bacteriocin [Kofleriaceae bacterium]
MKTLTTNDLNNVNGGASKNTELTTALTNIQSSIKDVASQKNNNGFDSTTMLMMAMMMSQRQGPTVVAAGAPAAGPTGPIVNISTRVRRGW